jgi:adenosylcobyric acid synthase
MDKSNGNKSVMMQGCASSVGKSLLTAAFCRIIKQDGFSVAPFKSQNMALNSFITKAGHEMGRAQVVQAEAAGIEPDVAMNPILLKPTSDKKSQIIVNGKVYANMDFIEYHSIKPQLKDMIKKTYETLASGYEYIVLEGAGSPAEINLADGDIVNMGMAKMADCPVILIGDIDKGGVFAFIAGTLQLLTKDQRKRVKGVIINKFRGDVDILKPGIDMLEDIIGIPVLGVVPYLDVDIEDEDSVSQRFDKGSSGGDVDVAVIKLPHLSNYTDYNVFSLEKSITMRYVDRLDKMGDPDLLILPGTKNTIEDLLYLKSVGLDEYIVRHAKKGKAVVGVCGGYQMLANALCDPYHIESRIEKIAGLGLLDMDVVFEKEKVTTRVDASVLSDLSGMLKDLGGTTLEGYEIHMGKSSFGSDIKKAIRITKSNGEKVEQLDGVSNQAGNVFGSYIHGVFDNSGFLRGIVNNIREQKGLSKDNSKTMTFEDYKQGEYDRLADIVRNAVDMDAVYQIMRGEM